MTTKIISVLKYAIFCVKNKMFFSLENDWGDNFLNVNLNLTCMESI